LSLSKDKVNPPLELAIGLVLMAGVPVFIKFTNANIYTIGLFRVLVASFFMALLFRPFRKTVGITKKMLLPLLIIGLVFGIHWITYFLSIKTATASIGLMGMSTFGINLIFLGWVLNKTKPSIYDLLAVAIAFSGSYMVVPNLSFSNDNFIGFLIGGFSGMCFALLPILHQKYQHIHNNLRAFGQFAFAIPVFLFFIPKTNWELEMTDWLSLIYLAIPGTLLTHWLWIRVTTTISTTTTSVVFYLVLPFTMAISFFWLGESMPLQKIAGAGLIILGNICSFYGRYKKKKENKLSEK